MLAVPRPQDVLVDALWRLTRGDALLVADTRVRLPFWDTDTAPLCNPVATAVWRVHLIDDADAYMHVSPIKIDGSYVR